MPTPLHIRRLRSTFVILLGACLVSAGSASASVLSFSGAERPLAQDWANYSCQNASRVQEVSSPVAQGTHAYRLEVRDGDYVFGERCEIGMGNPGKPGFPLFHEGDERWISFQVYLPDDYPIDTPDWQLFFQIHQQGDGGCPPISLGVENGRFRLFKSARNTYVRDTRELWSGRARHNRWVKFTLHIKNSTDPNVGFVELFGDLDGTGVKTLLERTATHTMTKDPRGGAMTNHARVGIYRDPAIRGNAHILFDGFTIATERSGAESSAWGEGPGIPALRAPSRTHHHRRVWLRIGNLGLTGTGSASALRLYGGVRPARGAAHRAVNIQARYDGRWWSVARSRVRTNGRFSAHVRLSPSVTRRPTQLRAVVPRVGRSNSVGALA